MIVVRTGDLGCPFGRDVEDVFADRAVTDHLGDLAVQIGHGIERPRDAEKVGAAFEHLNVRLKLHFHDAIRRQGFRQGGFDLPAFRPSEPLAFVLHRCVMPQQDEAR